LAAHDVAFHRVRAEFRAEPFAKIVQRGRVQLLSNEGGKVLPEAGTDMGVVIGDQIRGPSITSDQDGFDCVPCIDVKLGVLRAGEELATGKEQAGPEVFHAPWDSTLDSSYNRLKREKIRGSAM